MKDRPVALSLGRIDQLSVVEATQSGGRIGIPEGMAGRSAFRILLRNFPVCEKLYGVMQELTQRGKLDVRLRELVIMRIAWLSDAEYEWAQHWRVAQQRGLTRDEIAGVRDWKSFSGYTTGERAVLAATDETIATETISPETWRACETELADAETLIELVVVIGYWRLFAALLRSLKVPLDEGDMSWPPDGIGPTEIKR